MGRLGRHGQVIRNSDYREEQARNEDGFEIAGLEAAREYPHIATAEHIEETLSREGQGQIARARGAPNMRLRWFNSYHGEGGVERFRLNVVIQRESLASELARIKTVYVKKL